VRALFGVIVLTNLMVNMDHGIFPACIDEVRKDINIGNQEVGLVGSIVYLGLVAGMTPISKYSLGSLVAIPIFSHCNTKFVLVICLLLNAISLVLIGVSNYYALFLLSRFLVGFF
jgi:MFS family permease